MSAPLSHEAFASKLNTTFRIYLDDSTSVEAELVEVSDLKLSAMQERFAIVLRGPNDRFLGQGTRRFEHDELGEFDLFIVPISKDDNSTYYEAVFNRLVKND